MEASITRLLGDKDGVTGAFGYWRENGKFCRLPDEGARHRHRRHRPRVQDQLELVGVHGRRSGLAYLLGAEPSTRVHAVPPHRHGLAALGSRHLITEGVRGEGGTPVNKDGKRIMFNHPSAHKTRRRTRRRRRIAGSGESTSGTTSTAKRTPDYSSRATSSRARFTRGEGRRLSTAASSSTSSRAHARRTSGLKPPRCTTSSRSR